MYPVFHSDFNGDLLLRLRGFIFHAEAGAEIYTTELRCHEEKNGVHSGIYFISAEEGNECSFSFRLSTESRKEGVLLRIQDVKVSDPDVKIKELKLIINWECLSKGTFGSRTIELLGAAPYFKGVVKTNRRSREVL